MINTSNDFGKNHVGNSNTIPGFMKKTGIMGLLLVQVLIGCNSKSTEDNKEVVPAPIEVVEPPKPVETHKPFIVNGKEIGSFLYRDNNFSGIVGLNHFDEYQNSGTIHYISKDGIIYLFPAKTYITGENDIGEITELQANGIQPLTASMSLVKKGDKSYLYATSIASNGLSLSIQDIGEITNFVSLVDSTISDVQNISEFPRNFPRGILLSSSGKKYYIGKYDPNHKSTEITDVKVVSLQDKKIPYSSLHMTGVNNQKYALGAYRLIQYDKIGQTTDGQVAYLLDGNLMSFGIDGYAGGDVYNDAILAIKSGKIQEYIQGKLTSGEDNKENNSLTDAINKQKPLPPVSEYKDISKQFIGFKVRYIGVNYGESEDYCYSSDGSNYYTFVKSQNGFYTANKVSYVDNIVSTLPLSDKALRNHMFTGSYLVNPYSTLRYIGIQNGFETVEYTVRGAEGNRIQNGDEVENILIDEIIAKPEGYKPNFFYKDGAQIKKLEATTPCPQGTKIIIRYSK